MISLIIPTYRNPDYLDICLKSAIENQVNKNEIIVAVDGYFEESAAIIKKYNGDITLLDLGENQGMQTALNLAVMNATNEIICIINDDNILCKDWDIIIEKDFKYDSVMTIEQIEPVGPSIFNFHIYNFGLKPNEFSYDNFLKYEPTIRENKLTDDGGIFPFVISKRNYMIVGGFDTLYQSPFICDWDFFLKLDLNNVKFYKTHNIHFYHFGSAATKNGKEADKFKNTEHPATQTFLYKWGINPLLLENNSHKPSGIFVKGIKF